MISNKFHNIPDDLLARYIEERTNQEETRTVTDAVECSADLWLLRQIVTSGKKDGKRDR